MASIVNVNEMKVQGNGSGLVSW